MSDEVKISVGIKNNLNKGLASVKGSIAKLSTYAKSKFKGMGKALGASMKRGAVVVAAALGASIREAYKFEKAMARVSTVMSDAAGLGAFKQEVKDLAAELGTAKDELTNGLYQALSAGVPQNNAIDFLRTATKASIGGVTSVETAVDGLTTVLNAFNMDISQTDNVADALFLTVKNGKTTFEELAAKLAIVAPLASSSGIAFEEVLSAVASITKQGTPTAQAMTQIRASIVALNQQLGDGWAKTMTYQEGLVQLSAKAGGSQTALKKMTGSVEAMSAVLAMSGKNSQGAADDLTAFGLSAGEAQSAFEKMSAGIDHWARLAQEVKNKMEEVGSALDEKLGPAISRLLDGGRLDVWFLNLKDAAGDAFPLIEKVAGAVSRLMGNFRSMAQDNADFGSGIGNMFAGGSYGEGVEENRARRRARQARNQAILDAAQAQANRPTAPAPTALIEFLQSGASLPSQSSPRKVGQTLNPALSPQRLGNATNGTGTQGKPGKQETLQEQTNQLLSSIDGKLTRK